MKPSIGRIVHYMLTAADAEQINQRRTTSAHISERIHLGGWPLGAQAHVGNPAEAGQVFPMLIVRVWGEGDLPVAVQVVNGKVELDGSDSFWVTSVGQVAEDSVNKAGCWFAPPRV
jgi:hypothetical protein